MKSPRRSRPRLPARRYFKLGAQAIMTMLSGLNAFNQNTAAAAIYALVAVMFGAPLIVSLTGIARGEDA